MDAWKQILAGLPSSRMPFSYFLRACKPRSGALQKLLWRIQAKTVLRFRYRAQDEGSEFHCPAVHIQKQAVHAALWICVCFSSHRRRFVANMPVVCTASQGVPDSKPAEMSCPWLLFGRPLSFRPALQGHCPLPRKMLGVSQAGSYGLDQTGSKLNIALNLYYSTKQCEI